MTHNSEHGPAAEQPVDSHEPRGNEPFDPQHPFSMGLGEPGAPGVTGRVIRYGDRHLEITITTDGSFDADWREYSSWPTISSTAHAFVKQCYSDLAEIVLLLEKYGWEN